jgi:hypothetical protein
MRRLVLVFSTEDDMRYNDRLIGGDFRLTDELVVVYDGQRAIHSSDRLIANPSNNIHVFHRTHNRTSFTYLGRAETCDIIRIRTSTEPVRIAFGISQVRQSTDPLNPYASLVGKSLRLLQRPTTAYRHKEAVYRAFGLDLSSISQCGVEMATIRM